uniref:EIF-4F 25 kDa subunit n=1 Tax=Macrostomum lignano TaxID=282301 RepID=A0A1I8IBM7_9PLAT
SIAENQELTGRSIAENKELTGSSIENNKKLTVSSIENNKELTGSSIENNKELTGSSIENNKELTGSSIENNKELTEIFIAENKELSRSSSNEPIDSSTKDKKEDGSKRSLVADQPKLNESCHNTEESGLSSSKAGVESDSDHTDSSSTLDCNSVCEAAGECFTSTNAEDAASDALVEPLMKKHLLNSCWTLWFYKSDRSRAWLDSQLPVASFSSVEDFWRIINFAMPPSRLPPGCDYSVFRAGCPPMWEAPDNCNGGRWMLSLDRRSTEAALVDKAWTEALLMAIGEAFSDRVGRQICGLVVQIRSRHYRLCLWTRHAADQPGCFAVGRLFRSALQKAIQPDALPALIYEAHANNTTTNMSSRVGAFASCSRGRHLKSKPPMYNLFANCLNSDNVNSALENFLAQRRRQPEQLRRVKRHLFFFVVGFLFSIRSLLFPQFAKAPLFKSFAARLCRLAAAV